MERVDLNALRRVRATRAAFYRKFTAIARLAALIRLRLVLLFALPRILADAANLEQIVLNLVVNARDAIPGSGEIRLGLQSVTVNPGDPHRHADARPGRFLCLSVADNGKGMDETVLAHLFEPFFTTKNIGHGTGLGLSTVSGIVRQNQGWIEVDSTPHVGTTFSLFLPALAEEKPPAAAPVSFAAAPQPDFRTKTRFSRFFGPRSL